MVYPGEKPITEKSRGEIEQKLKTMGDYVKMNYLQRALRSPIDFDTKKFVLLKLTEIYEQSKMYLEAARMMKAAAEINTTFKDKTKDYMKSVECYIKGGDYAEADRIFAQALALGSDREKAEMKTALKNIYYNQAKSYSDANKRNYTRKLYEKMATMPELNAQEKKEVQVQLMQLYEKLGLIREYYNLKRGLGY